MIYLENNLVNGEEIVSKVKINWFGLIPYILTALFFIVIGLIIMISSRFVETSVWLAIFFGGFGLLVALVGILTVKFTELGLTNKRLIGKTGLIIRKTLDAPLGKINNIGINQGIFGRIFGYGTLAITTSSGAFLFAYISMPYVFKNSIIEQIDIVEQQRVMEQAHQISHRLK